MSQKFKVTNFELVDHGIANPSYFQGCGTAFTDYEYCATGTADTPAEAFDDLLEMIAQMGPTVEGEPRNIIVELGDLEARILEECGRKVIPNEPSAYQNMLRNSGIPDGFDEDEDEPDREDFESDEEYEEVLAEYKQEHKTYQELQDCEGNYYHMSLRFNLEPIKRDDK